MALEIENNLVAAIAFLGGLPASLASFGIASLVKNGVGDYAVTTVESLGAAELATTCLCEDAGVAQIAVRQTAPNQYAIVTFDAAGVPIDSTPHLKIFRVATGS